MNTRHARRHAFTLACSLIASGLLAISSASAQATSNTWDTNAAGNWTTVTNWFGDTAYAEGADNTATFGNIINDNRIVTLNAGITIGNITASDTSHNYIISGANVLTLDVTTGAPTIDVTTLGRTLEIASEIAGNDGIRKIGTGTLALYGTTTYTGTTTIQGGILDLGKSTADGSLASTALALSGGALNYTRTGSNTQTFSTTSISGGAAVSTVTGTLALGTTTRSAGGTLAAAGTITTSFTNDATGIIGPWASFGTLAATTYATMSGSNIAGLGYTGGADGVTAAASTDVPAGAGNLNYTLGAAGTLGDGASVNTLRYTGAAGTLTTSTSFTNNGLMNSGSGLLTISGNVTIGATNELVVNAANNGITFSNAIGNNGLNASSFIKTGSGTVILNGTNTYTGDTYVNQGTLQIGSAGSLGGGTYAGSIFIGTGATLRISRNGIQTLSGIISGDGGLIKEGGGTLFLGNSNTYTGQTTILPSNISSTTNFVSVTSFNSVVGGTSSSSLGAPTAVANGTIVVGAAGTGRPAGIEYTGAGETTDRVINFQFNNNGSAHSITTTTAGSLLKFTSTPISNRSITANSTGSIILSGDGDGEFSQGIPVGVSITKSGSGTWTLGGAVGIGPKLTVEAGTLALQKKSSLHNGDTTHWTAAKINVKSGATLALNVDSGDVDGLSAASLDTLLTAIYGGTSTAEGLQAGAILGLNTSTATGGTFTQGNAITDSTGTGGGSLGLAKLGTGTLILDKTNTYTGATTVTGGTLLVNGSTASGTITVNPTATLGGTGTLGGAVVVNGGGTVSPGASVGTLAAGDTTWNDCSSLRFEIDDAAGTAGGSGGSGWDLLDIAGTLDLTALTTGGFTVVVDTLLPGGGTNLGQMANFDPDLGHSWEFARTTGGITGFDAGMFLLDLTGFANPYDGTFEVTAAGDSLYITFSPSMDITDPGVSTVVASPVSVPADGISVSTITVTVKSADGTGLAGKDVTLAIISGPGMADIAPAGPVTTDPNGVATFTATSNTAGTEEFTATDITGGGSIAIAQTASVEFTTTPPPPTGTSQTSLIPGYTPPAPPPPDAPQTSLAATTPPPPQDFSAPADGQTALDPSETADPEETVPGVIRVTEYYLTTGDFDGPAATLYLDQDLAPDYFILVRGSRDCNGLSMPDSDYARVAAVPGGHGGLADSGAANRIGLRRAAAEFAWEGVVTVVECLAPDSPAGFRLVDAVVATLSGTSGSQVCAPWGDATRVVPFGGYRGGGVELTGGAANRYQGTSAYVRLAPSGTNTLDWQRDGGGETLSDAVMTTFVVEWGAGWTVQHAAVVGSNGGDGADAAGEYTTAAIAPVARASTWVWGTGIRADAGIGDCAESCLVTLGDGANQNAVESAVAVGSEYTDAYSFDVYAMTHPALAVDHRFKPDGDLKGLDIPAGVNPAAPGARFAWLYNGCNGTSSRFPRPRMWSRYTADATITISRGYDGAEFPAWIQGIDFSGLKE